MDKLSGMDASFLHLETSSVQMHVAFLAVLEPGAEPFSFPRLSRELARRVDRLPALRRKLAPLPLDIHHPAWIEDEAFDPIHHIRDTALPAGSDLEALGNLVARIDARPIDRQKPLWELWIIEGLEGGRFALLFKIHHALADGVSGARLFSRLFDGPEAEIDDELGMVFERPEKSALFRQGLLARLRQPRQIVDVVKKAATGLRDIVTRRKDPAWEAGGTPLTCPRTPWNEPIGTRRDAALATASFDVLREIKTSFDVTVNDVVLALTAATVRRYLEHDDFQLEGSLLAVCPVSIRTEEHASEVNNLVSAMFARLFSDVDDPGERLMAIHRGTQAAKWEHQTFGPENLSGLAELTSVSTLGMLATLYSKMRLASRHRPFHNLVISNVPGPRESLSLLGSRVRQMHAMGPVMEGAGLNVTVLSSGDTIGFAFHVDADLVPNVHEMPAFFEEALARLLEAARAHRTSKAAESEEAEAAHPFGLPAFAR
jgi:diacylglycerol O-acyltransferase / wax synthase